MLGTNSTVEKGLVRDRLIAVDAGEGEEVRSYHSLMAPRFKITSLYGQQVLTARVLGVNENRELHRTTHKAEFEVPDRTPSIPSLDTPIKMKLKLIRRMACYLKLPIQYPRFWSAVELDKGATVAARDLQDFLFTGRKKATFMNHFMGIYNRFVGTCSSCKAQLITSSELFYPSERRTSWPEVRTPQC